MSEPTFFVIGATHHNAPIEVREKLVVASESALRENLARVPSLRELVVLATCNRIEFYGVGADKGAAEAVQSAYCALQKFEVGEFEKIRIKLVGREAALHLFEVASGLDSQLLGENEIFGQVKDAYAAAQSGGTAGSILNRVFQKAFQAAKHVRTNTGISSGTVSIANVAVDLASNIFGSLANTRVLVLGTGEIGEGTARAFRSRGAADLAVAGRTSEKAVELAAGLGASTVSFEERDSRIEDFDIIVCSTAAPAAVLSASAIRAAMRRRPARPLLLIDMAFPRDVEAAAADLQNVFLYNLDDLAKIAEQSRAARQAEAARGRVLLGERADALWRNLADRLAEARVNPPGTGHAGSAAADPSVSG